MWLKIVRTTSLGLLLSFLCSAQSEHDANINQRILKIRELGKRDSRAIPALAVYLNDPDSDIRLEAVKAIVRIDTEHSIDALVEAAHDKEPEIEILATDGLVNAYMPGYVAKAGVAGTLTRSMRQVKAYFDSRNDQVIAPDVVVRPDVQQALSEELAKATTADARANAARAAGILRDKAAVPALVQGLHSKDGQMIIECLIALQKIGDTSAGPGVAFLTQDLEDRVQITALETIGVLRCVSCASNVRLAVRDARNVHVQRAALEALAMLGLPGDRSLFLQYASDRDPELRAAALEGLGRVREPADTPLLQQAYDKPNVDWRIHLAAAFGLVDEGKVGDDEFAPLPYLVESLSTHPRANAASAYLTELARRDDVLNVLVKMIPQATKDQKEAFCSIFAASGNRNVVPALTNLTRDIEPDVALAASNALRIVKARGIA